MGTKSGVTRRGNKSSTGRLSIRVEELGEAEADWEGQCLAAKSGRREVRRRIKDLTMARSRSDAADEVSFKVFFKGGRGSLSF